MKQGTVIQFPRTSPSQEVEFPEVPDLSLTDEEWGILIQRLSLYPLNATLEDIEPGTLREKLRHNLINLCGKYPHGKDDPERINLHQVGGIIRRVLTERVSIDQIVLGGADVENLRNQVKYCLMRAAGLILEKA